MNGLDLFSGIGGITIALHPYVKPVAYCEIEPYCQSVLLQRMQEGNLPQAPIWDDIRTLRGSDLPTIDIIAGGFPCQDISIAGAGKGLEGERSGLFFEIMRLAKETRPKFIFLENVPAITGRGGLRVVSEIASLGYDCRWCVISAASVGALHRRERWFLLAHSQHNGAFASQGGGSPGESSTQGEQHKQAQSFGQAERAGCLSGNVADTDICSSGRILRKLSKQDEEFKKSQKSRQSKATEFKHGCEDATDTSCEGLEGQWGSTSGNDKEHAGTCLCCEDACDTQCKRRVKCEHERWSRSEKGLSEGCCSCDSHCVTKPQTDFSPSSQRESREAWGELATEYWPFESRIHWQEVKCEFCGIPDGVSHTMDTSKNEVLNAEEKRPENKLPTLQTEDEEEEVWNAFRGFIKIQDEKVLLDVMQLEEPDKRKTDSFSNWEAYQEIKKKTLRTLQLFRKFRDSSQGQKQTQQHPLKFNDALLFLSHIIAPQDGRSKYKNREIAVQILRETCQRTWFVRDAQSEIKEVWTSLSEEEKDWTILSSCFGIFWNEWPHVERATGENQPHRVDRLKALGNSVVPIQVRQAFELLIGISN